eukprot:1488479-Rhodomonas_salina.2
MGQVTWEVSARCERRLHMDRFPMVQNAPPYNHSVPRTFSLHGYELRAEQYQRICGTTCATATALRLARRRCHAQNEHAPTLRTGMLVRSERV